MHLEQPFESRRRNPLRSDETLIDWFSFDEKTLSILTSPNSYDSHVEVQVDDVIFVGHTLALENNSNLKSFAIFFVLRVRSSYHRLQRTRFFIQAIAKTSFILSYQEMSKRIGTAIRCEEQRTSYLNQEYAKLISVIQQHDVVPSDPCIFQSDWHSHSLMFFSLVVVSSMPNEDRTREREETIRTRELIYSTMVEQSPLAATLKQIYIE